MIWQAFRYGNIRDIYTGGFRTDGYAVKLMDVPGMGHALCSPQTLNDGIAFCDNATQAAPIEK
jgi:hypothetical protein